MDLAVESIAAGDRTVTGVPMIVPVMKTLIPYALFLCCCKALRSLCVACTCALAGGSYDGSFQRRNDVDFNAGRSHLCNDVRPPIAFVFGGVGLIFGYLLRAPL